MIPAVVSLTGDWGRCPQGKAGVAQMVQQFPLHLRDDVTRRTMAAGRFVTDGGLAQPLIGRTEQLLVGDAMAQGEAPGLLMGYRNGRTVE